jgi:hypothetical protein
MYAMITTLYYQKDQRKLKTGALALDNPTVRVPSALLMLVGIFSPFLSRMIVVLWRDQAIYRIAFQNSSETAQVALA